MYVFLATIHGAVWFFVGLGIWLYSAFISARTGNEYPFFTWVAVAFMFWGAIRLSIQYWPKKKERKPLVGPPREVNLKHIPPRHHGHSHKHVQHHHNSPHQTHTHIRSGFRNCSNCHHRISINAHSCPHCHHEQ